jgi:hypothetical protein
MNALTSVGLRRARSRKRAGRLEDFIRAMQLEVLALQALDLLTLLGRRQIQTQITIGLGLPDAFSQRLRMNTASLARDSASSGGVEPLIDRCCAACASFGRRATC